MTAELFLYGRSGCHLCDDLRAGLLALQPRFGFHLREIDVDTDPDLAHRYGSFVPVLELDGEEVCHYFLDAAALTERLNVRAAKHSSPSVFD